MGVGILGMKDVGDLRTVRNMYMVYLDRSLKTREYRFEMEYGFEWAWLA